MYIFILFYADPEAYTNWQKKFWLVLRQFVDAKDFGEIVFIDEEVWQKSEAEIFDTRNHYLKGINHDYSETSQISIVISKLQAMLGYLKVQYILINIFQYAELLKFCRKYQKCI